MKIKNKVTFSNLAFCCEIGNQGWLGIKLKFRSGYKNHFFRTEIPGLIFECLTFINSMQKFYLISRKTIEKCLTPFFLKGPHKGPNDSLFNCRIFQGKIRKNRCIL